MRTNQWLAERLIYIHGTYFSDIPIKNTILVRFGRASKSRFGSIIARPRPGFKQPVTFITINSLFKDETVPDYVIDATLAHEFAHYTHGFHSPLERRYKFPHKGNVVGKELHKRGAHPIVVQQEQWTKKYYYEFLRQNKRL